VKHRATWRVVGSRGVCVKDLHQRDFTHIPHKSSNPLTGVSVSVDRIASQTIAACAASMAQSITHNHKIFPLVYHCVTRINIFPCTLLGTHPPLETRSYDHTSHIRTHAPSQSGEGTTHTTSPKRPSPNERTCIGWHTRYASVFGRSSRGIHVPRR